MTSKSIVTSDSVEPELKFVKKTRESNETLTVDSDHAIKPAVRVTPSSLLANGSCKVQSLTFSDQHATLLVTHNGHGMSVGDVPDETENVSDEKNEAEESTKPVVQSLLKLTLVPFHKAILGSNPVLSPNDTEKPEVNLLQNDPAASTEIISFLRDYVYELQSESGAEYSYYKAAPSSHIGNMTDQSQCSSITNANEDSNKRSHEIGNFDVELISPATKRQISRAMPSLGFTLIHETPELYETVVYPYIKGIVDGNSLEWINNVIEVKKEKERLIVNSPQFIVNIDTKWRTHPPPLTTPRKEWYGHSSVEDLYCLGIVKEKGIASLRDLTGDHIPLLKNMQKEGLDAIERIYGVQSDQIRCFVHYQPQFYHFHVHFTRLENEVGSTVEKGHLLEDIVQNLQMDPFYYKKRTITYKLKKMAPLQSLIEVSRLKINDKEETNKK